MHSIGSPVFRRRQNSARRYLYQNIHHATPGFDANTLCLHHFVSGKIVMRHPLKLPYREFFSEESSACARISYLALRLQSMDNIFVNPNGDHS
jgi:hypothetical protein